MFNSIYSISFLLSSILLLSSCQHSQQTHPNASPTLFSLIPPDQSGVDFVNHVEDQVDFNILTYRNFYNGGGVALGDINNDGLVDIYFTSNMGENKLYLNKGNVSFEDITEKARVEGTASWSTGVSMVDVNADGWLDIYVCNSGDVAGGSKANELFINQQNLTFTEEAAKWNLNNEGYSTHASFFDYDQDGDLDCYLLNNSVKDPNRIELYRATREVADDLGGDKLMRNDGDTFTDVTLAAGLYSSKIGFGLGVTVSDINGDYLPDIYVSNDFWERDYMYLNRGDGTFSEELNERTAMVSLNSMGSDIADINNDGAPDIMTTDMLPGDNRRLKTMTQFNPARLDNRKFRASYHYQLLQNCLQLNTGNTHFQEMAHMAGVSSTDWSWGTLLFDVDNDGWKDIFVSNGVLRDITDLDFVDFISDKENVNDIVQKTGRSDIRDFLPHMPSSPVPNYLFINEQTLRFSNQAEELGVGQNSFSNGAAYGDVDNDGDLDLVINNQNQPAFIYRNHSDTLTQSNYISLKLEGGEKNTLAIGTIVHAFIDGQQQSYQQYLSRSFQSSVAPGIIIGLGNASKVDSLIIIWPNLQQQTLTDLPANQSLSLSQENATQKVRLQPIGTTSPLFEQANDIIRGDLKHTENAYDDFDHEALLPKMLSTESPRLLVGDVNGDQLDDILMLCAAGYSDKTYLQQRNGTFSQQAQAAFDLTRDRESVCGSLADIDGDGDLDAIIGTGGNEYQRGFDYFKLRVYENNGKGTFEPAPEKGPKVAGHFSAIEANDIDQDGDMDLFIGGRTVPGNYGLIPESFLIINKGNNQWSPIHQEFFANLGMVTDATWVDVNGDSWDDLMVVGDWMSVYLFINQEGALLAPIKLSDSEGWWTRIHVDDIDQDGDMDAILGNWGLNARINASSERPLKLHVGDFDNNKKSEFVLTYYPPLETKAFPFATKTDIINQLPYLKKSNIAYHTYAEQTYQTLFSEEVRKKAYTLTATTLESTIMWNEGISSTGELQFKLSPLPLMAQIAPVFGIATADMDHDGLKDIWLGGNFYGLKPEAGRLGASLGTMLKGMGNRQLEYVTPDKSGVTVKGEVRDVCWIKSKNDQLVLIIARNDEELLSFRLNQ